MDAVKNVGDDVGKHGCGLVVVGGVFVSKKKLLLKGGPVGVEDSMQK